MIQFLLTDTDIFKYSNLGTRGTFLEWKEITGKGEYIFTNNIIKNVKYIYTLMISGSYNIQPMMMPVYLLSQDEYVTCYNDGDGIYRFGFKINFNDYQTIQVTFFDNITKAYICLLR